MLSSFKNMSPEDVYNTIVIGLAKPYGKPQILFLPGSQRSRIQIVEYGLDIFVTDSFAGQFVFMQRSSAMTASRT